MNLNRLVNRSGVRPNCQAGGGRPAFDPSLPFYVRGEYVLQNAYLYELSEVPKVWVEYENGGRPRNNHLPSGPGLPKRVYHHQGQNSRPAKPLFDDGETTIIRSDGRIEQKSIPTVHNNRTPDVGRPVSSPLVIAAGSSMMAAQVAKRCQKEGVGDVIIKVNDTGATGYGTFPASAPNKQNAGIPSDKHVGCCTISNNNVLNRWMVGCTTVGVLLTCVGVLVSVLAFVAYMYAEVLTSSNSKGK